MRNILMATMLLLLCAPPLASGATYQWRDANGTLNFTDDSDRIPAEYLDQAREIDSVKGDAKPAAAHQGSGATPRRGRAATHPPAAADRGADRDRLAAELKSIQEGLVVKRKELARLRHKWSVVKGRTPTEKEVRLFEEKQAKGKATFEDNPYVNKNPLSPSGPARAAYYKKLQEVQMDEERARQVEQTLQALK